VRDACRSPGVRSFSMLLHGGHCAVRRTGSSENAVGPISSRVMRIDCVRSHVFRFGMIQRRAEYLGEPFDQVAPASSFPVLDAAAAGDLVGSWCVADEHEL